MCAEWVLMPVGLAAAVAVAAAAAAAALHMQTLQQSHSVKQAACVYMSCWQKYNFSSCCMILTNNKSPSDC